jgi:hypothetical protein
MRTLSVILASLLLSASITAQPKTFTLQGENDSWFGDTDQGYTRMGRGCSGRGHLRTVPGWNVGPHSFAGSNRSWTAAAPSPPVLDKRCTRRETSGVACAPWVIVRMEAGFSGR